jgi:hypothetical protein
MVDKVKPLKLENPANGGSQLDFAPTAMNPSEDYANVKGLVFENDDNSRIEKDADGDIVIESPAGGTVKLRSPIPLIIALG